MAPIGNNHCLIAVLQLIKASVILLGAEGLSCGVLRSKVISGLWRYADEINT